MQLDSLERDLLDEINPAEDCLRLYRLHEPINLNVKEYGKFTAVDFDGPLVL